jgi:hypothetical protein
MRVALAIFLTIFLIGGVFGYVRFSNSVIRLPEELQIDFSKGDYSINLTRTFECEPLTFLGQPALKVMFKGDEIFVRNETLPVDEPVLIEKVTGVEVGENEILVSANMASSVQGLAVIKVEVLRNDVVMAEKILTGDSSLGVVSGPVVFTIGQSDEQDDHQH